MMIKELCSIFSPSGQEESMCEYLKKNVSDVFDTAEVDNIGNLICRKNGKKRGFCIECGMDSCGVMIISKEDEKAFVSGVGGVSAVYLAGKKIVFGNGEAGVVRYDGKSLEDAKLSELYIEVNTKNINIGDFGVVADEYFETSDRIFANGIAAKAPIAAVVKAVRSARSDKELTVIFSAQHRFAARGVKAFLGVNEFSTVLTVDGISCGSGIKEKAGGVIVATDKNGVSDKKLRSKIKNIAADRGIKTQIAVTDENLCIEAISTSGVGTACNAVAIPVSHKGKPYESVGKADFDCVVELIKTCIEKL